MLAARTLIFALLALASHVLALPLPNSENETWPSSWDSLDENQNHFNAFNFPIQVQAEEISDEEWLQLMTRELKRYDVLGGIVDQVPPHVINIDYSDHACAHLGNQLSPSETKQKPSQINFPINGTNVLYTLVAIDPDVPSRKNTQYSEFLNWLVVNIPRNNIERGNTLAQYVGPLPSENAGLHRFIFLVYRQVKAINVAPMPRAGTCDWAQRARFSAKKFAQLYDLGKPEAINYFVTEFDQSVPQVIQNCLHS